MDDSTPERQNTSLLDGDPPAPMQALTAPDEAETPQPQQAQRVKERSALDVEMDQFADYQDFEEAVLRLTEWLRDKGLYVEWNPF